MQLLSKVLFNLGCQQGQEKPSGEGDGSEEIGEVPTEAKVNDFLQIEILPPQFFQLNKDYQ